METPARQELSMGVVSVLWLVALVTATVDGAPWSLHVRLTVGGGVLEVAGIALLALDLVAEPVRRMLSSASEAMRRFAAALVSLFSKTQVIDLPFIDSATVIGTAGVSGAEAFVPESLADQVAELRRQLDALRSRVDSLDTRLTRDVRDLREELSRTREDLERAIERAIEASKREYHEWRLGGFAIALAGSVMLSVANVV